MADLRCLYRGTCAVVIPTILIWSILADYERGFA